MAHIFKKPNSNNKGIIVITHQELGFIARNGESHPSMDEILKKYFVGVHYGGFSFGAYLPPFCSFYMGLPTVTDIKLRQPNAFDIPMASGNFTSCDFSVNLKAHKYWDIVNVSRNSVMKNLRVFFREVKKIYDLGYKYKILLICPSRHEEDPSDHFVDIVDVYYQMFTKEERDLFTLMRLSKDLEFKGLSKKQLSFFYQSSKVFTLFSETEGFPGVVPEALLTGLPVVMWKHQRGSGKDYLDESNSILFDSFDSAHSSLIQAVEGYDKFSHNHEFLAQNLREDHSLDKIKKYFERLYNINGQNFDGDLINVDDLVSRLPAHYSDLPWANNRHYNGHIKKMEQFKIFVKEALG
tara:strand:- start:4316 stop:5371 length:1056 start_codon:yes stop_codon:yes gene_type:complete